MADKLEKKELVKKVIINGKEAILHNPDYYNNRDWLINIPQALYRNSIFSPVSQVERKISHESQKTIEVNNLCKFNLFYPVLNQTHANIIDAMLCNAIRNILIEDKLVVVIAQNEVMRTLHIGHNYSWFAKKVKEIQDATFVAYDPDEKHKTIPTKKMPLIIHVENVEDIAQNRYVGAKKTYAPYKLVFFSQLFIYLTQKAIMISYPKPLFFKILELKYPINQAIARYCIGSVNVNENLERLLVKLGVATGKIERDNQLISDSLKYNYFSMVKQEQDKLLEYFNIEIKPLKNKELGVFRKVDTSDVVRITNPKQKSLKPKGQEAKK